MASFDENGKYIKTNWKAGDKITATKLNKIEESIEAVNDNDISRHVEADARLDALEAKDVAHDKEFTNVKNLIEDAKDAAELGDYEINSRMQFLEQELNEGIEEVHNVAETVDGKIATAEANMTAQVNQGKADMEAMVAEVEADLEGLHAKDEELSAQLEHIEDKFSKYVSVTMFGAKGDGKTDDTEAFKEAINYLKSLKSLSPCLILNTGKYVISSTLTIPLYIKLVTDGNVEIKYTGDNELFYFYNEESLQNGLNQNAYNIGNILDGSKGCLILRGLSESGNQKAIKFGEDVINIIHTTHTAWFNITNIYREVWSRSLLH